MARKEARPANSVPRTSPSAKWKQRIVLTASAVAIVALCVAIRNFVGTSEAEAQVPNPFGGGKAKQQAAKGEPTAQQAAATATRPERPQHDVMAVVNGQDIRRDALARACVDRFGEEVLEGLVNKRLISHHCRNRNLQVTDAEIDAEIDRMAARFKIGREQWLEMLQRERGISAEQYKRDILWPTLALRKLAAEKLTVTEEQLQKAYEAQFGPAVKCRLLVVDDRGLAEQLHRHLVNQPDEFARLAMKHSQDVNSASIGGMIQPIRRHVGDPAIEQQVFSLKQDQISAIIPIGKQLAILKCEGHLPARNVPLDSVRAEITEQIKEESLREVASDLFQKLQDSSTIQNVWNDPQLRAQMPGIVATINGEPIRYQELADECLLRFGEQVLDVEISHLLLQQALAKYKVNVTQQDLDAEMAHAAQLSGVTNTQGQPDLEKWIKMATEEQGVSRDLYLRDSVWPSAALKKLTTGSISVTDQDIQKGYEANYSERVRCRAIVLDTMRRAQEVWSKARQNPSPEYFGDLAEEYSVEPTSKALRGEVPPIQRWGGQKQLEDVAFELAPGELSGIIQMGDKFVILKCEGRTKPVDVNQKEVREILQQDIFEKKLRLAMSDKFQEIHSRARIDNFLAGTSQAPERVKVKLDDNQRPAPRVDTAVRPSGGPVMPR